MRQSALAREAKVPVSIISMVEAGIRSGDRLSVDTARKIARALGVTLDYLCGMYDEDSEQFPTVTALA